MSGYVELRRWDRKPALKTVYTLLLHRIFDTGHKALVVGGNGERPRNCPRVEDGGGGIMNAYLLKNANVYIMQCAARAGFSLKYRRALPQPGSRAHSLQQFAAVARSAAGQTP